MSKFSPAYGYKNSWTCPNFRQKHVEKGFLGRDSYFEFTCSCTRSKLDIKYIDSVCTNQTQCKNCSNYKKYGLCN